MHQMRLPDYPMPHFYSRGMDIPHARANPVARLQLFLQRLASVEQTVLRLAIPGAAEIVIQPAFYLS